MSTPINRGGPAFPQPDTISQGTTEIQGDSGISMRDYFAAKAITGACSGDGGLPDKLFCSSVAERAYTLADEMIKRRSL